VSWPKWGLNRSLNQTALNTLKTTSRAFSPVGWSHQQMNAYVVRHTLDLAAVHARTLPTGPFTYLIKIPLVLAYATLNSLACGEFFLLPNIVHARLHATFP